jgi:hypothetical protein
MLAELDAAVTAASGIHAVALHFHQLDAGDGLDYHARCLIQTAVPAEAAWGKIGCLRFGS